MADVIRLLPDSVANQIAAGEVIQRPASVVKELLENSIDAGSNNITLNIKDAGKTLVQVIDNGCGMSETDARMSFERHATSKISKADDLFAIRTKGFRGEAMASIAAIAHVELKTKLTGEDLGVRIVVEGTTVTEQEPTSCPEGTSIAVKNLFFNVPARRNFLKSNPVETKHIIEEFQRVAMAHPGITMEMHHNGNEVFKLNAGSFRQRIVGLFGNKINQKLVPVEEETNILKVSGFIGKPEFAKKTRGEQFFFANDRFIKSPYLNHAVQGGFDQLISKDHFPTYFLKLEVDPSFIDINIHPTKTEVKFEDERAIYAILNSSVKQGLGKYNIAPTLDFEQETTFQPRPRDESKPLLPPEPKVDLDYNPFKTGNGGTPQKSKVSTQGWEELYKGAEEFDVAAVQIKNPAVQPKLSENWETEAETRPIFQLRNRYLVTTIKSGLLVVDQQRAHERITYEQLLAQVNENSSRSQQLIFPETLEWNSADAELLIEMQDDLRQLGFDIAEFGKNTVVVNGVPATGSNQSAGELLEAMLEQIKNHAAPKSDSQDLVCRALASALSIKRGRNLQQEEMRNLIDELFACEQPQTTPSGLPIVKTYNMEELDKQFERL